MVTNAKQTLEQYNEPREEGRSKLQPLFAEKDKKREALKINLEGATKEEEGTARKLYKSQKKTLNEKFKAENKDLIDKYNFLFQGKKLNEKNFQEFLKIAKGLKPDVDENMLRGIVFGDLESKETVTKSLEFEKDTFKISSEGWEEVTKESIKKNPALKKFLDKGIKVKANATGDVVEYMEDKINGALTCKKGEQIFITYDAFIREVMKDKNCSQEVVESKYMMTIEELKKKMEDKPDNSEEYKNFFNKEVNGHLAGYWDPSDETFYGFGARSNVWLVGGNDASFGQNKWNYDNDNRTFGFSGRLLKN